ncbi:Hypothetical protein R9X50_00467000 [Acrodontium crateriforme]|uniref:Exosome complex protein n=1 Tax=Acrodontium crateriforme TaxID=150365 RepID=A0AAQ3RAB8_9PEZI|nr:Hypothetical protein R9X50_00467000 [Acrodontium crateriforme]
MDTEDLHSLVEDLGADIDDLETSLAPLFKTALSSNSSKLPLLDKAKLYVLATYAVESMLFSALRLNGVDAKTHPVFQELSRVKEYFAKIKAAETAGAKRNATLDKEAAGRFIKHGLAGNEKYDRERAEREAKEKARAKRKLEDMQFSVGSHTRFAGAAKRMRAADGEGSSNPQSEAESTVDRKAAKEKRKQEARLARQGEPASTGTDDGPRNTADTTEPEITTSSRPPRTYGETFKALLEGPLPKVEDKRRKKKRKSRDAK